MCFFKVTQWKLVENMYIEYNLIGAFNNSAIEIIS